MNNFHIINYKKNTFSQPPLSPEKYNQFFIDLKYKLGFNNIIYEKFPKRIDTKLTIERNRIITEQQDKLAVFSVGNPSVISMLWYRDYNTEKHIPITDGQILIFDSILYTDRFFIKQKYNNLYSVVFCDFKYYNIKNYINLHDQTNFNINAYFNIK